MSGVVVNHGVPVGRLVQVPLSVTLVNNTQLVTDIVVPPGKRWLVDSLKVTNPDDVGRAVIIETYLEAAATNIIRRVVLADVGATNWIQWPSDDTVDNEMADNRGQAWPMLVTEGNLIRVIHEAGGASAGGGPDADGIFYQALEIDI